MLASVDAPKRLKTFNVEMPGSSRNNRWIKSGGGWGGGRREKSERNTQNEKGGIYLNHTFHGHRQTARRSVRAVVVQIDTLGLLKNVAVGKGVVPNGNVCCAMKTTRVFASEGIPPLARGHA